MPPASLTSLATETEAALRTRLRADETEYELESVLRDFRRVALATLATVAQSDHAANLPEVFVQSYVGECLRIEAGNLAECALARRDATYRDVWKHWQAIVDYHYRRQWQANRWQPATAK